ncbi:MAG: vitamin B12-dependent ribonucleotide reductase, partial [Phycisphaerales bacterium]|nr:vitamin B12-dependent ribonucleotide reductase [Phycisphaerales bacterium]
MKITRKFTQAGRSVFDQVQWTTRTSRITNPDGSVVFEMKDAEIPAGWSQLATDIMVSKYFRKAGVPQTGADGKVMRDAAGKVVTGPEKSVKQVIHRLAGCWRHWGEKHHYFDSADDAQAFYDEIAYMLLEQMTAPNSPQWFNTGLAYAYGISGPAQGHWIVDAETGEVKLAPDAYTHPQPHACFIQSIDDDLVNPGGIMDLWVREARLFKYGSGTGTNFSRLRGENESLSGGGKSS